MARLSRFSTPANLADNHPDLWNDRVAGHVAGFSSQLPQFYDPTATDTPAEAAVVPVIWPAFPGRLVGTVTEHLQLADSSRDQQDEYCEWGVDRGTDGKITRVTFTTEVPDYFEHLFEHDKDRLLEVYKELTGAEVEPGQLAGEEGFRASNEFNNSTSAPPAHLMQGSNNLFAAISLAAQATALRKDAQGKRIIRKEELVRCGGLGEELRNSDPLIAIKVNDAAAAGDEITLKDPIGLYIDGLTTGAMATPDDEDPAVFWSIERGDADHTLRASYAVGEEHDKDYSVGDFMIEGRKIEFGAQLALRVRVRIEVVVKPGDHQPELLPCVPDDG